jgi:hypothetical protein
MNNQLIPIICCIDAEPDDFFINRNNRERWRGYEVAHQVFNQLRSPLTKATGSEPRFNWFLRMDGQIAETYGSAAWAAKHYAPLIADHSSCKDEIGLHCHAYRWETLYNQWVIDHGNQAWIDYCLTLAFGEFKRSIGRDCQSFRFGDRWLNDSTIELIEKLGARFDLTVEPDWRSLPTYHPHMPFTGCLPDYQNVSKLPYRPKKNDFRKPDTDRKSGLYIIPISTGQPQYWVEKIKSLYWKLSAPEILKSRIFTLHLCLGLSYFSSITNHLLSNLEKPYLAIVIRTNHFLNPKELQRIKKNFDFLMSHPLAKKFVFTTPNEALSLLEYF